MHPLTSGFCISNFSCERVRGVRGEGREFGSRYAPRSAGGCFRSRAATLTYRTPELPITSRRVASPTLRPFYAPFRSHRASRDRVLITETACNAMADIEKGGRAVPYRPARSRVPSNIRHLFPSRRSIYYALFASRPRPLDQLFLSRKCRASVFSST